MELNINSTGFDSKSSISYILTVFSQLLEFIPEDGIMKKLFCYTMVVLMIIGAGFSVVTAKEMKTATFNGWTVELPPGWSGDHEMGLYWPGEITQFMGRPPVSLHMGGIPVMGDTAFEERVAIHTRMEPTDKKDVTVEGLKGFTCKWDVNGKTHYGMFLEENVGGVMRTIHFFEFQAPVKEFPNYEQAFIKSVATAKK